MSGLDLETKRKLREMGAVELLHAVEAQNESLSMSLRFNERMRMAVDEAHSAYTTGRVGGLVRRAKLRYPDADLRTLDFVEERGLDQTTLASLGSCGFIAQNHNVVFQGFTGSGKSYLGCALAKQACRHQIRTFYVRMPDLEEEWVQVQDKPLGASKFLKKYGSYTLLVIDEWLLDRPDGDFLRMLLELMERRYGTSSTVFCTQYPKKDWHQRLGSGVHADAIMDRIIHNTTWFETGTYNMREQLSSS
ncbi:ATP-binding protein [Glutamicibacter ardleyensis]|uniref:ATP-binding protein n=1 Tax=Glutamicibacter ardleyensis TaxID=225894 RepID=UPI003FD48714